jgi:hypothetical protein
VESRPFLRGIALVANLFLRVLFRPCGRQSLGLCDLSGGHFGRSGIALADRLIAVLGVILVQGKLQRSLIEPPLGLNEILLNPATLQVHVR